jgi:hypothetical protein
MHANYPDSQTQKMLVEQMILFWFFSALWEYLNSWDKYFNPERMRKLTSKCLSYKQDLIHVLKRDFALLNTSNLCAQLSSLMGTKGKIHAKIWKISVGCGWYLSLRNGQVSKPNITLFNKHEIILFHIHCRFSSIRNKQLQLEYILPQSSLFLPN